MNRVDDYADVAQAVRDVAPQAGRGGTLRDQILETARRRWPHATRIELDAFGVLHVVLPPVIDAVCVEVTV